MTNQTPPTGGEYLPEQVADPTLPRPAAYDLPTHRVTQSTPPTYQAGPPVYYGQPPVQQTVIVNQSGKRTSHGLHLFLSIISGGLWIPVWIIVTIVNRGK